MTDMDTAADTDRTAAPGSPDELAWRISSYSGANSACVAAARRPDGLVAVRNSNAPERGTVTFTSAEWDAFLAGVKDGEFDDL
ncbi:MAG TPA: DUF397 domain-containing protein [Acidimicrobiales bacterium]